MSRVIRVGLGGLGAIGMAVARHLDEGVEGLELAAVAARDRDAARHRVAGFAAPPPVVAAAVLAGYSDVVVECAPAAVFRTIAEPVVEAGRCLIAASVGALLDNEDLIARARRTEARIIVPSGALLGLDAVRAAAQGEIRSVKIVTRKPPASLAKAPAVQARGLDLLALTAPLKLFEGCARDAIRGFPANVNVAVALSLAGVGPERTEIEIWADPGVDRNTHRIVVDADSARLEMSIANVPSAQNPGSGKITALSLIATLRNLVGPLCF